MKCEIAPEKSALSLIAEIITDALVRVAGSKREAVNVPFENHAKEDWVIGGRGSSGNRAGRFGRLGRPRRCDRRQDSSPIGAASTEESRA